MLNASLNPVHNLRELKSLPPIEGGVGGGAPSIMRAASADPKILKDLHLIFGLVEREGDWKAPIDREVLVQESLLLEAKVWIDAAVRWFTATAPSFEERRRPSRGPGVILRVRAQGYRMGPAGP